MNGIEPNSRPGNRMGQSNEFTLILPLKPGGAERMRKAHEALAGDLRSRLDRVATVHDLRFVIFDNDTRMIFASTFDGEWEAYIDDFATLIPEVIDQEFQEVEGYPGIHSPDIKEFIARHQVTGISFYSAYPDASVRDVWKSLKVSAAFDALLDTAAA
jgi:hypothetical protein